MKQTFTDTVEIDAPTRVGLVVTGPVAGVGAGAQLTTKGTGGRGWEILATGQAAAQGSDKLNIRDLGNGQDVFTTATLEAWSSTSDDAKRRRFRSAKVISMTLQFSFELAALPHAWPLRII